MTTKMNQIVVLDLEATCWEDNSGKYQEIIEIGICTLTNKGLQISDSSNIIVKPNNIDISKYCTDLTGITKEDVENGVSLEEALSYLKEEFRVNKLPWATWGAWDRRQIEKECQDKDIKNPFTNYHLDVKAFFPIVFGLSKTCSLPKAVGLLNLKFQGVNHSAADDALNTAIVLKEALRGGPLPKCNTKMITKNNF